MKTDVDKYIAQRKRTDKAFAKGFDAGYEKFKGRVKKKTAGISFRESLSGPEAYLTGHRVAVWEVVRAKRETKTIAKTAEYFRWPPALVRTALEYAKRFPAEIARQEKAETGTLFNDLLASVKEAKAIERGELKPGRVTVVPNAATMRTLKASRKGKNVKRFTSKKSLYADLGL